MTTNRTYHDWQSVQTGNPENMALVCVNKGCKATMIQYRSGRDEPWHYSDRDGKSAKTDSTPCVELK